METEPRDHVTVSRNPRFTSITSFSWVLSPVGAGPGGSAPTPSMVLLKAESTKVEIQPSERPMASIQRAEAPSERPTLTFRAAYRYHLSGLITSADV